MDSELRDEQEAMLSPRSRTLESAFPTDCQSSVGRQSGLPARWAPLAACLLLMALAGLATCRIAATSRDPDPGAQELTVAAVDEKIGMHERARGMSGLFTQLKDDVCFILGKSCENAVHTNASAANATGVGENVVGDGRVLASCVILYGGASLLCIFLFCLMRLKWPELFEHYATDGDYTQALEQGSGTYSPLFACKVPKTFLGWIEPSVLTPTEKIEEWCGLDHAMCLVFNELCIKIFAYIGIPLALILCPVHYFIGGANDIPAEDRLAKISFRNISEDNEMLFWVHGIITWAVIIGVDKLVFKAQQEFQYRRLEWLKKLSPPRSKTVLVTHIPDEWQSDDALEKYFADCFSEERLESVHIVKQTADLEALVESLADLNAKLTQLVLRGSARETDVREMQAAIEEKEERIREERKRLSSEGRVAGHAVNSASGFVTFRSQADMQVALHLNFNQSADIWLVSLAPDPADVNWKDLREDPRHRHVWEAIGYFLVTLLYMLFVPIVVMITTAAKSVNAGPWVQPMFDAIIPTLGLLLFTSFLPSILVIVFDKLFISPSVTWTQHKLQRWYFYFNVIFVLLVTTVGNSVVDAVQQLLRRPMSFSVLLARALPNTSNFFIRFSVMQMFSYSMEITRYINLLKYLVFLPTAGPAEARRKAEPEDQDYYGIGSRSARWTINAVIGLVYCQINPVICPFVLFSFMCSRLVYGYLIVFSETRKVDLGGPFWVTKLHHLYVGLWLYLLLMSGIFTISGLKRQAILVTSSCFYLLWALKRFNHLCWTNLPFDQIRLLKGEGNNESAEACGSYLQVVLQDKPEALQDKPEE